ncbi:MAG: hypothetical protein JW818_11960 [Pirellulales bacterium]|nr:hypothetical protein [Pirellulales bacterium]
MQLDRTRIVIREREFSDVLDLSLQVIRRYAGPLAIALLVGIAPLFALNCYLLSGLVDPHTLDSEGPWPFVWMVLILVVWEIPLATAPATLFLGRALFENQPSVGKVAMDFLKSLPQLIIYQVLFRALLVAPVLPWPWLFTQRAYLNEVILLERNPMFRGRKRGPSTGSRCQALHWGWGGDLFARWLGAIAMGAVMVGLSWSILAKGNEALVSELEWQSLWETRFFHLALWGAIGFFTVVRFLSYLDLRIRREGWEVELILRAEAARLDRDAGLGQSAVRRPGGTP